MPRYIDADEVIERLDMICDAGGRLSPVTKAVRKFCKGLINHQPTIEAEPVVRCKDCKYRQDDDFCGGRGCPAQLVPDDGYCDRGARMDGDSE